MSYYNTLEVLPSGAGLNTPGTYTLLTGDADKQFYQKSAKHETVITGPADFFCRKHNDQNKPISDVFAFHDMLLTFSISKGEIIFIENNSTDEPCTTITGKLHFNKDLESLNINKNYKYTSQQLADVLKFNRRLFADPDECMNIVTKLKNFTAEISQKIDAIDDKQGTKQISFMQKVSHEVQLHFILSTPVILGAARSLKFKVDIHFDLRDKAVEFWLESVELKEATDSLKTVIITEQIDRFEKLIPVIELP